MPGPPSPERRAEVDAVAARVAVWAEAVPAIRAVALVGSYAGGRATTASDVDLVVLTYHLPCLLERADWYGVVGPGARLVGDRRFGPVTERRLRLPSDLEVEVGVAPLSWADARPPDPGTAGVVRDGCSVLVDPDGRLAALVAACG